METLEKERRILAEENEKWLNDIKIIENERQRAEEEYLQMMDSMDSFRREYRQLSNSLLLKTKELYKNQIDRNQRINSWNERYLKSQALKRSKKRISTTYINTHSRYATA
jgi:hypothetical protein